MTWYTDHKEIVSLQYVFYCAALTSHFLKMTNYKEMGTLQYQFFNAFSNCHLQKMTWHTDHNEMFSLQNEFFYASSHHQLDEMTQDTDPKDLVCFLSFQNFFLSTIFVYVMLLQISTQEKCL